MAGTYVVDCGCTIVEDSSSVFDEWRRMIVDVDSSSVFDEWGCTTVDVDSSSVFDEWGRMSVDPSSVIRILVTVGLSVSVDCSYN